MTTQNAIDYHQIVNGFASKNWRERCEVSNKLKAAGKKGLSAAKQAFNHGNWRVRVHAVDFMDHHANDTCVRSMIKALKDPNERVRRSAIHSFSCDRCKPAPLQTDVMPYLLDVVANDRSVKVRRVAMGLLSGKQPDARAIPVIEQVIATTSDKKLLRYAREALCRHRGERGSCGC
ncbi:MAG TPA: HEAT repeat domain-containing protein [Planctomycetota bacterium]|nr:HEAT repeat domain-containing protein [Planctomycetota bacterium]